MKELTYFFTRNQLLNLLSDTIKLYNENRMVHDYPVAKAISETSFDMLAGLDADKELASTMLNETLRLQLPDPQATVKKLEAEVNRLKRLSHNPSLDEALNSGNGTYKP